MWSPSGLFGAGGDDGRGWLGDPAQIALAISLRRHKCGRAAAVHTGRSGPARGLACVGHRAGVGGGEPGGCGPGRGTGASVIARRGNTLRRTKGFAGQRRRLGGAARPPPVGAAGEADRGAARRAAGVGAGRAGPGSGRDQQLPAARHCGPHPGALGGVLRAVCPVADAAPHGPVVADDAARPPQGRPRGAGAI